jgi:CO/xanthine dehydrogenase FAD-binding subunit
MAAETLVPTSADEAVAMFGDGDGITVFGGGTILMPQLAGGRFRPARVLMLHRSGLREVEADAAVAIGAMVTLATVAATGDPVLARFASEIADGEVRVAATVGGNLCAPSTDGAQRGDLGAPLIALGASVLSAGDDGARTEPVEDFLAGDRSRRLVLGVQYDAGERAWAAETMRRRHAHSYSVASVAVCSSDGALRIGVSGVAPTAVRCRAAEESGNPDDVLKDVEPVDDALASAEYRRKVLPLLVRRALDRLESS